MSDLHTPASPAYLSDQARAVLQQPIVQTPYPPLEDAAAWIEHVEQVDQMIVGMMGTMMGAVTLPVTSELREIAGVPTYIVTPEGVPEDSPIFLDFHGGALIYGGGDLTRVMGEIGSLSTGLIHWSPDYRMPPEHPYPAGLDDAVAVYRALLDVRDASQIVVGGGSAGGNLAAALMLRIRDEALPMPAALVLNTPEVDLTESGDSFATLAYVSVGLQSLREVNELYAAGNDLDDPYLSPLFADVTGFPPTFLSCGTRDLFLSNTVRMHRRLREAGVSADLHVIDARPHAGFGQAPEEAALTIEQRQFIHSHV